MDFNTPAANRRRTCWKALTKNEKKLSMFLAGTITLIVILICLLFVQKSNASYSEDSNLDNNVQECGQKHQRVCLSASCIKASAQILSQMDFAVSPCDDFYRFVCGNYMKTTTIPDDKTSVNTFTVIVDELEEQLKLALGDTDNEEISSIQKVKRYYQSCINKQEIEERGINEVRDIITELGGWPVVEGRNWNEDKFNWLQSVFLNRKLGLDTGFFIDFSVGFDFKNSSRRLIQLDQPNFGLSREFLLSKNTDLTEAYYNYMVDIAIIFGATPEIAAEELSLSLKFEKELANYSLAQEDRRDTFKLYNLLTIAELNREFPSIDWLHYIKKLLPSNVQVTEDETVILGVPKYIRKLEKLIRRTPKRVLANYAIWRVVKSLIPYLSDIISQRELKYLKAISGQAERPPRWKECVEDVSSSLPILVGSLYVRKYVHRDTKTKVLEMVTFLKQEFINILKTIDWMDDESRNAALEKALTITEHIAYPDELLDDKKLEELFSGLEIYEDQFLKSSLNIALFMTDFYYSRLHQPVNKTDWIDHGNPAQVNAFYHPIENSIVFPAGILQGQLFGKDRPRYLNFGAIGSIIGHEITHGFDDTGRQFNKDGNLANWWAQDTQKSFLEKARCIINQYGNYTVKEINEKLNGKNTQGENIADNGGVKEAYFAYKTYVKAHGDEPFLPGLEFTPEQLFWVSAASNWCSVQRPEKLRLMVTTDTHSPGEFRVLGPFSNLEYFSKDFNCPLGSKMNPKDKCTVW
ncbi:neprilysin-2 [Agrilus planipennis]|uniref:Neprilysin-2 n=1 Tax=Agrilus planipennis TaxID=224129 RepID=A0A7F5R2V4_AGRPL|nr:neprilysin-2 [Agrilus planipennis]